MNIVRTAIGFGLCGLVSFGSNAFGAAEASEPRPEPYMIQDVAFEYDADDAVEIPPVPADGAPAVLDDQAWSAGCNASDDSPCCNSCCCDGGGIFDSLICRGSLGQPQLCALQRMGIATGGWVQAGITANANDPSDKYNGPVFVNDRAGEAQMNQLWLYAHRPVDTGGDGFDIGGRFDLLYGTDWRAALYHGTGVEDRINESGQLYGFSPAQFYGEVGINNLSVKVGRMTGILGYEVAPPMANFFYSHSYAISYGEPLLITGAMAKYKLADQITILGGAHQGVHLFEDNNSSKNFQGGVTWTSCDQRTSLAYAMDIGKNDFLPHLFGFEDEYIQSIVFKRQLNKQLLYVLQSDLGVANGVNGYQDAEWYSIGQYLMYTINDCWSAGARLEWFRDDDGTRVIGMGNLPARGWDGLPGFNGAFTNLSLGLNWKPKFNMLVRPEVRWDWYDGTRNWANELPFDGGNSDHLFTAALDFVVMF